MQPFSQGLPGVMFQQIPPLLLSGDHDGLIM
jgi:hypothetical protein